MGKTSITLQEEIKSVDHKTGEITLEVSKKTFKVDKEPSFVKLYVDDVAKLYSLPKGSNNVLYAFLQRMGYDGLVVINTSIKRMIAKDLGVSVSHISNSITKFIEADVMARTDIGIFILNPSLFAKGLWADVRKHRIDYLEVTTRYTINGKQSSVKTGK